MSSTHLMVLSNARFTFYCLSALISRSRFSSSSNISFLRMSVKAVSSKLSLCNSTIALLSTLAFETAFSSLGSSSIISIDGNLYLSHPFPDLRLETLDLFPEFGFLFNRSITSGNKSLHSLDNPFNFSRFISYLYIDFIQSRSQISESLMLYRFPSRI